MFSLLKTISFALALSIASPCVAQDPPAAHKSSDEQTASRGLPAEAVTSHAITADGDKIGFTARAGAIRLRDAQSDAPQADVAYVSYERTGADPLTRPVVFVFNGGPGASSAWLGLGALSPWRLRFSAESPSPSTPPLTMDNAESWIGFADLVFIDPPGTGYSKILSDGSDAKRRFYSVDGDADSLAVVIRKWLTARGRLASPKFIAGESYGAFRALKLVGALRRRENIGVEGLYLVSPALDFSWLRDSRNPLVYAALLPSFAAIERGAVDENSVQDAERYAAGDYVVDLLKGTKDAEALSRIASNVTKLSGLDQKFVARLAGRVNAKSFARERGRNTMKVISAYDGSVAGYDPDPFAPQSEWEDPVLDSWRAPLGAAMTRLTIEKLGWPIGDARYVILNGQIAHDWDYGHHGRMSAEVLSDLRDALALDERLKVVVAHGLDDLVTPYFATKLMLDQLPAYGDASRLKLIVLKGGHMPYLYDDSRRAMRDVAKALVARP